MIVIPEGPPGGWKLCEACYMGTSRAAAATGRPPDPMAIRACQSRVRERVIRVLQERELLADVFDRKS